LEAENNTKWSQGGNVLLEQITAYARANLAEQITLKGLAAQYNVSVSTITQTFQRKAGVSFHKYLTECRVRRAVELMEEGIPLEEVGRQVGYSDHSSFYRAFVQCMGSSPREYRKQMRK
jgi:two-component system response regulator YesN